MSALQHHGIEGQKWGVRRFQNKDGTRTALGKHRDFERTASKVVEDLSNSPRPFIRKSLDKDKIRQRGLITQDEADQCAGLATGIFKQASQVEPQITGDVIDVVSSTSAKMYGLNNRLKQPTSIAAKIGADAKSDGVTFEQAANGLKDVIRYTAVSDSRDYVDTYNAIKQRLEEKGYTEVKCKNYFQKYQNGEVMHKAVQSTFRNPDGVDFEFQFQTPESQAAKELKVPIYNERRKAGNTSERNAELEQEMRNLAEQVQDPEGVFEIKSHSGTTTPNKLKHTSINNTSYLSHHGIKGQRWGVRRYQNPDGTRTELGKKQLKAIRLSRNEEGIRQVYRSLSDRDLNLLGYEKEEIEANRKDDFKDLGRRHTDYDQYNRVRYKNGDAVGYIAATGYQTAVGRGKKIVNILAIDLAVNSNYRGQGYSVELGKDIVRWFDRYGSKEYDRMEWYAKAENIASQKAAERSGFERRSKKESAQGWVKYSYKGKKVKHSSIGGIMYVEGSTLILGDTSYLEHHGILGQKWGVRRFQNKDGSLTALGRKKLGYAVKGAGNLAKKAASASFNAGKKAVTVAKEKKAKAEEEKLAARKAKASKTRVGVLANKDLFTSKEMEELNKRFKVEDEMKLAVLNKGMAYVDAIGKVGKAASSIGKAYKDLTGEEMFKNAIEEKREEAKKKKAEAEKAEKKAEEKKTADAISNAQTQKQQLMTKIADKKRAKEDAEKAEAKARVDEYNERIALKKEAKERDVYNKVQEKKAAYEAQKERSKKNKQIKTEADDEIKQLMDRTKTVAEDIGKTYLNRGGEKTKTINRGPDAKANQNESLNKQVRDVSSVLTSVANQMKSQTNQTKKDIKTNNLKRYADSKSNASNEKLERSATLLAGQIKLVQSKIDNSNRQNKPTISQQEDARKLRELSALTEQYQKAANDPRNDPTELTERYLEKGKRIMAGLKHSDIYSDESLSHYGVLGMKWGKHIMKGKGSLSVNDSVGGGGGAPEEDEEEEENLLEYTTESNKLPGKKHYDKSTEFQKAADKNKADLIAARKAAQKAISDADALEKKVKSVNIFNDRKGYLISEQRAKDKKRVKELRAQAKASEKEAAKHQKTLTENSKKALNEYNKWQKSPSGHYDNKMKKNKHVRHSDYFIEDGTLYLCHHGIKGQRWGVRRFQNPDGTLTPRGRKKVQKKVDKLKRKQVASDNLRGTLERKHPYAVAGSAIAGAIMGSASFALSGGTVGAIAAGAAICSAVSAASTHGSYSIAEAWEGRGSRRRKKKIAKYENMLQQDGFFVNDGTLYLSHHGIKGQKHGVRRFQNLDGSLTAAGKARYGQGKVDFSGGGGGAEEEDEELTKQIEEAAKKAGLSVEEYRKKFADKISEMKKIISMNPIKTTKGWTGDKKFNKKEYGDLTNRVLLGATQDAGNLYLNSKKDAHLRAKTSMHYERSAAAAEKRGDNKAAEMYNRKSNEQLNKAIAAEAYKDYAGDMVNDYTKAYVKRNTQFAANAKAASLKSTSARKAGKIAERNKTKAISEAKAKIKSGKLPINEVKRYAESSVGQLSSMAKAELAERERNKNLSKMGSRNAKATSHVHTNSSTTTDDARNEKNALNYKRVNSRVVSAKAKKKKDTLTYSGRKKKVTSGTGSIGKSGSGRKHSQR